MRSIARGMIVLAGVVLPAVAGAQGALPSFKDEFLGQFNASMEKLIALAEAMPAEKFAWAPGAGVMPVGHVYSHIAHYNYGYPTGNLGVAVPAGMKLDTLEQVRDKAGVVALLKQSRDFVRATVQGMPEEKLMAGTELYGRRVAGAAVLFQLVAHMNEHLGQSIAYARMNGVVPPWSR